jgi:hypothetical protein
VAAAVLVVVQGTTCEFARNLLVAAVLAADRGDGRHRSCECRGRASSAPATLKLVLVTALLEL